MFDQFIDHSIFSYLSIAILAKDSSCDHPFSFLLGLVGLG